MENLIGLAQEGGGNKGIDLSETAGDAARLLMVDEKLRRQALMAVTEGNRLHIDEVMRLVQLVRNDVDPAKVAQGLGSNLPKLGRDMLLAWSDGVLSAK